MNSYVLTPPFPQSSEYEAGLEVGNAIFAVIFNMEAVLKLYALRMQYFKGTFFVSLSHHQEGLMCVCSGQTTGTDSIS